MLFHLSIDCRNPERVAGVISELWGGAAMPFPPVAEGSWLAMAGDDRGTLVEVYPRGTELHMAPGAADAVGLPGADRQADRRSATHFAMATTLDVPAVLAIAEREGWPAKVCRRGDAFGVVEMWVEGDRMVEVLTPEMQAEYQAAITIPGWRAMLASGPAPA